MPIDKDSSDRWFTHFVKNWQAYFYAETPDYPGQLVSPSKKRRLWTPNDGVFVPKYSSVAESARREENPMSDPAIRALYPGTMAANPVGIISESRQIAFHFHDPERRKKIKDEYVKILEDVDDPDQKGGVVDAALDTLLSDENYRSGFTEVRMALNERLEGYYQRSKSDPVYASNQYRWDLEQHVYRAAREEMHQRHQEDARQLLQNLEVETRKLLSGENSDFAKLPGEEQNKQIRAHIDHNIAMPFVDNISRKEFATEYSSEEIDKIIDVNNIEPKIVEIRRLVMTQKILAPIQKEEIHVLEQATNESRFHFLREHEHNMRWARICAQQRPKLLTVAMEIHRKRCEEKRAEERERLEDETEPETVKTKPLWEARAQRAREDAKKTNKGEILPDTFLAAYNPEGLPTLDDFKEALETNEDIKKEGIQFQFQRSHYFPGTDQRSFRGNVVTVSFETDGSVKVNFDADLTSDQIRRDPNVRDVCEDIVETLWSSCPPDTPPADRRVNLWATSEAHAEVLVRAALMRGFPLERMSITVKDASGNGPTYKGKGIAENFPESVHLAGKYRQYVEENRRDTMESVLETSTPQVKDTQMSAAEIQKAQYLEAQTHEDATYALKEVQKACVMPRNNPAEIEQADKALSQALERLNTLRFDPARAILGRTGSAVWGVVKGAALLLAGAATATGYAVAGNISGAQRVFGNDRRADEPIAVKDKYYPVEVDRIGVAAQGALERLRAAGPKPERSEPILGN